jgi:hypothetical protein
LIGTDRNDRNLQASRVMPEIDIWRAANLMHVIMREIGRGQERGNRSSLSQALCRRSV